MTGPRRWLRWVGVVVLGLVVVLAALVARVLWQRAEHRALREAEVGRAPVAAPRRSEKAVTGPVAPAPDSTLCLHGQVLDHGAPVGGMQVSVPDHELSVIGPCACRGCRCREGLELLLAQPSAGLLAPVISTRTQPDGTYTLCGLEPRELPLVWGEHEDGRLALPSKEVSQARPGSWVPLDVVDLVATRGLVRANQRPLAGARVLTFLQPAVLVRATTTDEAGRFQVPLLPGGSARFLVSAEGRRPVLLERMPEAGPLLVLELDDPFQLTVRVTDEAGPAAGAEVQVGRDPPRLTDPKGEVLLDDLPTRERLRLTARKGDLVASAAVWTLPGASQRLELALAAGVRVRGAILDEQGQPRIGRVRGLGPSAWLETDAKGRFESEPLEPSSDVYPEAVVEGCDAERSHAFRPGERDQLLLKVRCAPSVEGVVLDADGAPISNALVSLQSAKDTETVSTDGAGRFTLHQPPGSYRLKVTHERYRAAEQPLTAPAKDVTVVLDAGGSLSGRVVDEAGKPVAGAEVLAVPAMLEDLLKELEGGAAKATTDAQGQFTVTGLLAGRWVLAVTGNSLPTTPSETVVLQPGQHRQGLVITVEGTVDLTGVVVDRRRQPVPGAEVRWDPADEKAAMSALLLDAVQGRMDDALRFMPSPAFADAEGRFELRGLPVSRVKLDVTAPGFRKAELEASKGGRVEVTLERVGGRVKGRVIDERGRPVPRFEVNGTDFASGDGRFEVAAYSNDDDVRVRAPGYAPLTKDVTLDGPEQDVGDLALTKGLSVRVTVRGDDGKPLEGVRVAAAQTAGGDSCTTRPDGTCALESFVDEDTQVKARKAGFEPAEAKLERGRFPETLDLTLKAAGGRVVGQVFGAAGQPAAARSVFLSSERASEFALTDGAGRFEASGLAEGDACASVELSGLWGTEWALPLKVTTTPSPIVLGPGRQGGTLEIGAKLPGRVVVLEGEHPPMRTVDAAGDSASSLCTNKRVAVVTMVVTGTARIEGLPPGRWSVYVIAISDSESDALLPPKVVDLQAGETKKL